jgi:hypothetical protein
MFETQLPRRVGFPSETPFHGPLLKRLLETAGMFRWAQAQHSAESRGLGRPRSMTYCRRCKIPPKWPCTRPRHGGVENGGETQSFHVARRIATLNKATNLKRKGETKKAGKRTQITKTTTLCNTWTAVLPNGHSCASHSTKALKNRHSFPMSGAQDFFR